MEVVSIHQPCYIPYLGVFYKIWQSDKFVYLDDAQYSNGYVFDWNRIKTPQGECRLKIPTARAFGQKLTEVTPKDFLNWKDKHLKTIRMNYKKAPHFSEVFSDFSDCILSGYGSLAELNMATMNLFIEKFGWQVNLYKSSDMKLDTRAEARVIDIVQRVGGDTYISGIGGKNYQSEEHFANAGIKLIYSDFTPPAYRQQWGDFLPNMSVLDYCMNEGYEINSLFEMIKKGDAE
jgi:hypothetical protein